MIDWNRVKNLIYTIETNLYWLKDVLEREGSDTNYWRKIAEEKMREIHSLKTELEIYKRQNDLR